MTLIKSIYDNVKNLSNDDISGAMGSKSFNLNINLAQKYLQDYYLSVFVKSRTVIESLKPFMKEAAVSLNSGSIAEFPSDHRFLIEIGLIIGTNADDCSGEPTSNISPVLEMKPGEKNYTLTSSIRKPSIQSGSFRYEVVRNGFKIYPKMNYGMVQINYIMNPPEAVYGVIPNTTTMEEDYNENGTTDLIWPVSEMDNFVDLLLFMNGIEIRQSELMTWVRAKQLIT